MIDRRHDDFGNGTASESEAECEDLFVETRSATQVSNGDRCSFIVGARGTGKSLLLYRRRRSAQALGAVVLPDAPVAYATRSLMLASGKEITVDRWSALWEVTLLRSIVVGWLGSSLDLGTQRVLDRPADDALRRFVIDNIDEFPPTAIFLDDELEETDGAPARATIARTMGCLLAVAELRRLTQGRIQFTMTVTPEILWRLDRHAASSGRQTWRDEVVRLTWADDELLAFWRRRVASLDPAVLATPEPIAALLGESVGEPMEEWLLRSTLRRPRDLVVLGNAIVRATKAPVDDEADRVRHIRAAVDAARERIAHAYLAEVGAWWPWQDRHETSLAAFLEELVPRNILTPMDVARTEEAFARRLEHTPEESPFAILASFGLLGHVEEAQNGAIQRFARASAATPRTLPRSRWYLVHALLDGAAFGIPSERGIVVAPDRPFDPTVLRGELRSPRAESQTLPLLSVRRLMGGDTLT